MSTQLNVPPLLDLSRLSSGRTYRPAQQGRDVDIQYLLRDRFPKAVELITGQRTQEPISAGFVLADPALKHRITPHPHWDDPRQLVYAYTGLGDDWRQCVADATRMMRLAARTGVDSIGAKVQDGIPTLESEESTHRTERGYRWADLQHGGAVWRGRSGSIGEQALLGATSGFTPRLNHAITEVMLTMIASEIVRLNPPTPY